MKEHPISVSGEMVKAIFEGRKTMTRRIVKPQSSQVFYEGDRLWVRETFAPCIGAPLDPMNSILYKADNLPMYEKLKWESPVFMPRWASRTTLEITDVRVEKLQDISEEDAKAEGVEPTTPEGFPLEETFVDLRRISYRAAFSELWTSLHGTDNPKSWDANPWVWVIEFKRADK